MILEQEGQLLTQIRKKEFAPVYLLYGEETYLKELYCRKIIKGAVEDCFPEFNLHQFDGNDLDMEQVQAAVESMPFMAERRCVVISPFPYDSLSARDKKIFDSLVEEPVESTVFVLMIEDEGFLPKKNQKAKKLVAQIDKCGVVAPLEKRTKTDTVKFLQKKAQNNGCSISKELCQYLMERCDNDMMTLANEIEKITAYAGQGDVTKEHIDAVSVKAVDARIYDLAKAILADRYEQAVCIIEELLYLRYQPTVILSALSGAYMDLYIAKTAADAGQGQPALIAKHFEYRGRDFVIRNSLKDCRKYCLDALRSSIAFLAQMDYKMKSSRAENSVLLEQTVTQLFLIARQFD